MLAALLATRALLERFARLHLTAGLCALWLTGALVLLLGMGTQQMYDFQYVCEGAQLFAQGNYKPMQIDYFNVYSYQLGICLPMEMLLRVFPGIDLSALMQGVNAVLSIATAGVMAAVAQVLFEGAQARRACVLLEVLFLPMALYCVYVYGTVPMLFCCACSLLCFALYLRMRRTRFGVGWAVMIAAAYVLKPNAAVPMIAMVLCAVLDALLNRDVRILGFALASVVLAVALARGVIWQYELRSGVTLSGDVSMLARLVMGLQEGGPSAGWFNGYTEQFFSPDVTAKQERAVASADLAARLVQMRADPAMTAAFFGDKLLSQWLEPTYSTMWYGHLCPHTGVLAQAAETIYREEGFVRVLLEGYMAAYQKALYILIALGIGDTLRHRRETAVLTLPLIGLGGFLYHMIFEAKSQYIYIYVMLMMPLAAQGLCALARMTANWRKKRYG